MPVYCVSKLELDAAGEIRAVEWGPVNTDVPQWQPGWPKPAEVIDVVDALHFGDQVYAVFHVDGQYVPGPRFELRYLGGGEETIGLAGPAQLGRTITTMEKLAADWRIVGNG